MSDRFIVLEAQESVVARLSDLVPENPFATVGYFRSKRQTGWAAWVLVQRNSKGGFKRGCGVFIKAKGL